MEISKKDFIKLVIESTENQFDEMAQPKEANFRPIYIDENSEVYVGDVMELRNKIKRHIGWLLNDEIPIIFTCGQEFQQFFNGHPELVKNLEERFGDDVFQSQTQLPGCQVRRAPFELRRLPGKEDLGSTMSPDTRVKEPQSSYTARQFILRGGKQMDGEYSPRGQFTTGLYALISEYLNDDEMKKHLDSISVPNIKANERPFLDRHGEISNKKVEYGTHSFHGYESSEDFLDAVIARIGGDEVPVEFKDYHLARLYNKQYLNWREEKKNDKEYQGKTDVYLLDRYGLEQKNLDLSVKTDFKINGRLNDNNYVWTITFLTKFGRKMKEDRRIMGGLSLDHDFVVTKTAQLEPGIQFDDKHPIIFNEQIREALIAALQELREKLLQLDPIETLEKANIQQYDIQRVNEDLKEKIVNKILDSIRN